MSKILKPKTIDMFIAKFVIKTLPTVSEELDCQSLNEIVQALYTNASTLPTNISG